MTHCKLLPVITLFSILQASAIAAITYSGFDAVVGSADGVSEGSGWGGVWDNQDDNSNYTIASGSPLVFGDLLTSGNYMNGGGGFQSAGRRFDTGFGSAWDLAGAVSDPFSAGTGQANIDTGTVWASMLVRVNSSITSWDSVTFQFHSQNIPWNANSANGLAIRSNGGAWGIATGTGSSFTSSGIAPVVGDTALLITKFELNASGANNAYFWVIANPASVTLGGTDPAVGTANASIVGATTDQLKFKSLHLYLDNSNNRVSVDEIRLGQTFASVTPVPEPSTYAAIAALGVLALAWLRRRQ